MCENVKQWQDNAEKIKPPKQAALNDGDVAEPKHVEHKPLAVIVPGK